VVATIMIGGLLARTGVTFTPTDVWMLIAIAALILLAAVLALAETGVTRMSRAQVAALEERGARGAERLRKVVENVETELNSVFLAVNILQTVQAAMTGVLADRWFGPAGMVVGIVLNVVVVFIIAEAAPKTWALQHSERAALLTAPLVLFISKLLYWPARLLIGISNVLLPGKGTPAPFVTEQQVLALAEEATEGGELEESERDLIESVIGFGDSIAREIMVPRTDMVAMQKDHHIGDMVEVAIMNGLSRFPVFGDSVDDVVGLVYVKDLMRAERDGHAAEPISTICRAAYFVPETKRCAELLAEMRNRSTHIAIVIDEYGGTAGLVTLEDLLEELVGEISDEHDPVGLDAETGPDGTIRVLDPSINVDDLNDLCELRLPEGDWDSVGGLVFSHLGRLPEAGDEVELDVALLTVVRMDQRRIAELRIVPRTAGNGADDE
jgi:CBS domain containing-hemolysin-like protein